MTDLDVVGPGQKYLWDGEYLYVMQGTKVPINQTVLNGKKRVSIRVKRKESRPCAICERMVEVNEIYATSTDGQTYCLKHVDGYEKE